MLIYFTYIPKNARLIILFLLIAICFTTARTRNKLAKKDMNEKQVIITAIGQCAGDEGLPVNVLPMDIIREGRFDYYIDGVVLIREDFNDGFKVKLEVLRCDQAEILETCTSVLNYVNTTDLCELLRTPVDAYTNALNQITPRPLCPLKGGTFLLHHLPTDDHLLKYLPKDDFSFFWKVQISGMVEDETRVMCLNLEFHVSLKRA